MDGAYVTAHVAEFAVGLPRVHGLVVNVPVLLVVKVTGPVGAVAPLGAVSVTVTVHVVDEPMSTGDGTHTSEVDVESKPGTTLREV